MCLPGRQARAACQNVPAEVFSVSLLVMDGWAAPHRCQELMRQLQRPRQEMRSRDVPRVGETINQIYIHGISEN